MCSSILTNFSPDGAAARCGLRLTKKSRVNRLERVDAQLIFDTLQLFAGNAASKHCNEHQHRLHWQTVQAMYRNEWVVSDGGLADR